MKAAAFLALCLFAPQAFAAPEAIIGSESPDKSYRVSVERIDARICYRIDAIPTGEALLRIPSSYQPEMGMEDWAYKQSLSAEIHWRSDSRAVAIEESNHRTMGTVLIARQTPEGFRCIPVDDTTLMQSTKEPWDRGRLFFGEWGKENRVTLSLGGRLYFQTENRFEQSRWRFELDLAHDGKILHQKKEPNQRFP